MIDECLARTMHASLYHGFDLTVPELPPTNVLPPSWRSIDRYESPYVPSPVPVSSTPTTTHDTHIVAVDEGKAATTTSSSTAATSTLTTPIAIDTPTPTPTSTSTSTSTSTTESSLLPLKDVVFPVAQAPQGTRIFFTSTPVTSATFAVKSSSSHHHDKNTPGGSGSRNNDSEHTIRRSPVLCRYASSCRDAHCRYNHATPNGLSPAVMAAAALKPLTSTSIISSSSPSPLSSLSSPKRESTTHTTDTDSIIGSLTLSSPTSSTPSLSSTTITASRRPCRWGAACHRIGCRFVHPVGSSTASAAESVAKTQLPSSSLQANDEHDGHDDEATIPMRACRYGTSCRKGPACRYSHPLTSTLPSV
jgi:hypothetical protein